MDIIKVGTLTKWWNNRCIWKSLWRNRTGLVVAVVNSHNNMWQWDRNHQSQRQQLEEMVHRMCYQNLVVVPPLAQLEVGLERMLEMPAKIISNCRISKEHWKKVSRPVSWRWQRATRTDWCLLEITNDQYFRIKIFNIQLFRHEDVGILIINILFYNKLIFFIPIFLLN